MLTPGIPGHVLTDLRRIVESEELGESFFRAAANRAREEGHAEAWHALHRLEVQTNCGVRLFIEHTGTQLATTHRLAEAAGTLGGAALNHLPWRMQLDSVRLATRSTPQCHCPTGNNRFPDTGEVRWFDRHKLSYMRPSAETHEMNSPSRSTQNRTRSPSSSSSITNVLPCLLSHRVWLPPLGQRHRIAHSRRECTQ